MNLCTEDGSRTRSPNINAETVKTTLKLSLRLNCWVYQSELQMVQDKCPPEGLPPCRSICCGWGGLQTPTTPSAMLAGA